MGYKTWHLNVASTDIVRPSPKDVSEKSFY